MLASFNRRPSSNAIENRATSGAEATSPPVVDNMNPCAIGDIGHMIQHAAERSPIPRPIEAEEVANTAAFLCSPLASAITGQIVYVDCGYNVMGIG